MEIWRTELDRKTRKLLTLHKGLHPKIDVDRLCVSRKEGGRELASYRSTIRSKENNVDGTLKIWMKVSFKEWSMSGFWSQERLSERKALEKWLNEKRVENGKEKQIHVQFIRDMYEGTYKVKSCLWLRICDLKIPSEALICSAQDKQ